jgi:Fasciclin domain
MRFKQQIFLMVAVFTITISGCKKWDDHIAVDNQDLTRDLYTIIANDPSLSKFGELISKAGLDTLLKSSKTYTIWAPSNDALASLDPSLLSDIPRLRSFLLNHISNQLYFTKDAQSSKRIGMLSGKYNNFLGNKFEDATLISADKFVKNGVIHIIDKNIIIFPNLWDYVNATTAQYVQNSFIAGLNFNSFDPSIAIIDSISSSTGLPVYKPGTGVVVKNTFNEKAFDLRREEKQYTYFVMANTGFTLKADSLKPYFASTSLAVTDSLDKWNIVKDLVIDTLYPAIASLPASFLSKFGITVPVNKSLVIETKKLSNGVAYVLSLVDIYTKNKFLQKIIEGEFPTGFFSDKTANTNYRVRPNPVTNQNYTDILVSGHGVTGYYSYYQLKEMPSMVYNVYALAVNDFQTTNVFQSIGVRYFTPPATYTTLITNPAALNHAVPLKTAVGAYNEVFLGTVTSTAYGTLEFRLTSGGTTLGSAGTAPIVLDYLRIVPVP